MKTVKKQFQGRSTHRYRDNPMEKRFALAWQEKNDTSRLGMRYSLMEYLFDENHGSKPTPIANLTERDWEVANTVIQWLGSHVGQCFLLDVLDGNMPSQEYFREELARRVKAA